MGKYLSNFFNEFRKFAIKGNVVDMAVGVVIGAAFGKIVSSLVDNIVMPPIGMLLGRVDFSSLKIVLNDKTSIKYGAFINDVISFLIVAFCIFLVIRQMNRIKQFLPGGKEEPATKTCPECLSTIPVKAHRCAFCTSILDEKK